MSVIWKQTELQARRIADAKGVEYSDSSSKVTRLTKLATAVGIDRIELRMVEGDAMCIERADGRFTVFLNNEHHKRRHRFSVAHEIAHILLRPVLGTQTVHRRRFVPGQDVEGRRIEELCDQMASRILMPQHRVSELMGPHRRSAASVPSIAQSCGVSFEAATRRFIDLQPGPCAMVVWKRSRSRRIFNIERQASNDVRGDLRLSFLPSMTGEPLHSERSFLTDEMVVSIESILVNQGSDYQPSSSRPMEAKVESFGRGRGRFRHVTSVVHISDTALRAAGF